MPLCPAAINLVAYKGRGVVAGARALAKVVRGCPDKADERARKRRGIWVWRGRAGAS